MTASITFLVHLLGFGILTTTLLAGLILEMRLRRESEPKLKLFTGGIARSVGLLSPFTALIMLLTGIANIHYRDLGTTMTWYSEGWLIAKIILFVVLVLNGVFNGPRLSRNRMKLVEAQVAQSAPPNAFELIRSFNRQMSLFYFVQTVTFLLILGLSVFGAGRHF